MAPLAHLQWQPPISTVSTALSGAPDPRIQTSTVHVCRQLNSNGLFHLSSKNLPSHLLLPLPIPSTPLTNRTCLKSHARNLEVILDSFLSHTFYIHLGTKSYHSYLSQTHLTPPYLHWHASPWVLIPSPVSLILINIRTWCDRFSLLKISRASYCLQQHFPTGKSPSKIKKF